MAFLMKLLLSVPICTAPLAAMPMIAPAISIRVDEPPYPPIWVKSFRPEASCSSTAKLASASVVPVSSSCRCGCHAPAPPKQK